MENSPGAFKRMDQCPGSMNKGAVAECKSSAAAFLFPEKAYTQQLCG